MPRDPEKAKAASKRYRERKHAEKYGNGAGDQRGKHGNQVSGSVHHRWNNSRIISEHGYIKTRVGVDHPLADPNGYTYEHLLVWVSAGNPVPNADEIIHHENEDKADNRLSNLRLMTRSDHNAHHLKDGDRRCPYTGRLLDGVKHNGMPSCATP